VQADVSNQGSFSIASGRIQHFGAVWHEPGSVLQGTGSLDVTQARETRFAGRINPGLYPQVTGSAPTTAALTFLDAVGLQAESVVDIEVSGTAPAAHDLVSLTGTLAVAGTLRVTGFGGWVPQAGDTLTVVRFAGRSGTFGTVTGLDFGVAAGGVALDTVWTADRLVLVGQEGGGGGATSGILFGVDAGTDALHRINVETGATVRVGTTLGNFATPGAMAIVPGSEQILVWSNTPSRELVSVNACTGVGTRVQEFSSAGTVGAIAYRTDDRLFGFTDVGLWRIDMNTPGRPLTTLTTSLGVRMAGADFTPDGRLFGIELTLESTVRFVEVNPANGAIVQSRTIVDTDGNPQAVGLAGSLTWNVATGQFLATSTRDYPGIGAALFDLSLTGVASNPRRTSGNGSQGIGFRSEPNCGG